MKRLIPVFMATLIGALALAAYLAEGKEATPPYRSPYDVRFSPAGNLLAVSDRTAALLELVDVAAGKVAREVPLNGQPAGVAWSADGTKVYVAERNAGTVAEVNAADGKVLRRLPVALRPAGVAVAAKKNLLVVGNTVDNSVSVIDLAKGTELGRVRVPREAHFVAVTPDESLAVVGNLLPLGNASDPQSSSCVSLIDLAAMKNVANIRMPGGSTSIRHVAVSPDGKWAYAVHTVGRTTLPTTQLERGWVNTNALSIIDLAAKTLHASVLLDRLSEGAADPWGIALSKDGNTLWVSLSGVHQVAKVDVGGLHALLRGEALPAVAGQPARTLPDAWAEIKKDPAKRKNLVNDLAALYGAGLLVRLPVDGKGPRGIALAADGSRLAVGLYFSGKVALLDAASGKPAGAVALGPDRPMDQVRRGESIFHDANYCFQHWLSCATCHPEDGRVDGLNWDLLNDGLGNPKNARSMVWSHKTPPTMSLGVRATMEVAAVAGFRYIQFHEPQPDEIEATQAYLRTLEPEPSPLLVKGQLSDRAKRGKAVFEGKGKCAACHPAPLFTDNKLYKVGTKGPLDPKDDPFDTPTLVELYRTGPYLHTGAAVTLQEVFTKFNPDDQHGVTKGLSKDELDDLVEYLLSL